MAEIVTVSTGWQQLSANVAAPSDNGFTPATDFRRAGPVTKARARIETRNRIGAIELIGAANFANSTFAPNGAATNLGSGWISAAGGPSTPTTFTDLTTEAGAAQLARFGYVTRNTSTTTPSSIEARAHFDLAVQELEQLTGEFGMVFGYTTATTFFPVTSFLNSVRVTVARGVYEVRGNPVTGLKFAWAYQLVNDPTAPGDSCTVIGSFQTDPSAVQYPTGWTVIDPTNGQLLRFGWAVQRVSGTGVIPARIGGQIEFGRV
jgi:hypothetical protein